MNTILEVIVGSRLHNLHNENSDYDYRGIFVESLVNILSPFKKQQNTSWIEGKNDNTQFELLNFIKMCASCNPTCLEILWSNKVQYSNLLGDTLRQNRSRFLSDDKVYFAHTGYAFNQMKKMSLEKPDPVRTPKTIIAYIRTLRQGKELLETRTFNPVYEYSDRDFLMEVKYNFNNSLIPHIAKKLIEVREEIDTVNEQIRFRITECDIKWIEDFILQTYKD